MAEEHKKSFMLYFDNYPSIAALPAEQRGELLVLLYRYAMAAEKAPTDPEEILREFPDLAGETRWPTASWRRPSAGTRRSEGQAAALSGRGGPPHGGTEKCSQRGRYQLVRRFVEAPPPLGKATRLTVGCLFPAPGVC